MEDETDELCKLIRDSEEFGGLQEPCEDLLNRGANPFRRRFYSSNSETCALEELLDHVDQLQFDNRIHSSYDKGIHNWPLDARAAFQRRQPSHFLNFYDFLGLFQIFLNLLHHDRRSFRKLYKRLVENKNLMKTSIPSNCFDFLQLSVNKFISCATNMNRHNSDQNFALHSLRDHFPIAVLRITQNVFLVMKDSMLVKDRISASGIEFITLFHHTSNVIKSLLVMNPHPIPSRGELEIPKVLTLLFCLVVKTVYFLAGYGQVLEPWIEKVLLRELAILIVSIFRTLRNYREICDFGKKFIIRVRTAISENQNGLESIPGAKRFFSYLQELEQFLQQPGTLQNICLEQLLWQLPFAADENIPDRRLPDGTSFRGALKECRDTGGLSVQVPLALDETFPANFLHPPPTPVQLDTDFLGPGPYSYYPRCFLFS